MKNIYVNIAEPTKEANLMYFKIKRILDFILALIGLVFLSPVFIVLIVAIKIDSPGPAFFTQKRVGIHKQHFQILKFRTMRNDTPSDIPTHLLDTPEQWITRVGKFLRKTSLDEIPQLVNILVGEMSIVGPRPALWNQYDLIEERDKYGANNIRPGLTGLAQISGRDELSIELKSKYDGDYVKDITFTNDIKIIINTALKVISHEGIKEGERNE